MSKNKSAGLTLVELMIYIGIFSIVAGLFAGILVTVTRIQNRENAAVEVTSQLNFVMQTVRRLVRESSLVETAAGTPVTQLKLRMADTAKDPTIISVSSGVVYLQEGAGAQTALTSDRVVADSLAFTRYTNYPGHDTVQVDIALSYNTANPQQEFSKTLRSAIARVSAATFDSNVLPGTDGSYDVGQSSSRWRDGNFSGTLNVSGNLIVGASNGASGYLQARRRGAGAPTDSCTDTEWGRFYIDTTNNRLYICGGTTRGWDHINLID